MFLLDICDIKFQLHHGVLLFSKTLRKGRSIPMSIAVKQLSYPHITYNSEIAGGAPIIEGTRITVRCIAGYYQMGMSVDEIMATLHHLNPSQVHSALAYYFDHQNEINKELEEISNEEYWKEQVLGHPAQKGTSE